MDEVWKDISLSSLPHSTTTNPTAGASTTHHPFNNMALQDFFPSPLREDQPTRVHNSRGRGASSAGRDAFDSFSSQAPPPATILSLNSVPEFHNYLERDHAFVETSASVSSLNSSIDALTSSTVAVPSSCKKRAPVIGDDTGDRRHKRMIKNRESASRSRARKQAYTNELELEVAHLTEENAKLRREQEKFYSATPAQLPKNNSLRRIFSAPF